MSSDHANQSPGASIELDGEHETPNGWLYTFTISWDGATTSDHELTLAWVDHEHHVGGAISPSVLARRAMGVAVRHLGQEGLPARCDVSSLRRLIDGFDEQIRSFG